MSSGDRCRECGAAIPADSPGKFCARCLLGLGLSPNDGEQKSEDSGQPSQPGHTKDTIGLSAPLTEKPGDRIGRYRLLEEIGHGGCGVVYMAEQVEPVRRKVALKVIKLGMDTREFVARFEAERQALALMDHPNIAKVLDAGATDAGRPYFVMELVGGIKITDYCNQNQLTTPHRLELFMQVCRAIQHAHQKGIIHRDIKPSNVLVAMHDGAPVPKVIDFGIAKATQGRLTDQTIFTAFEQFLGTPAYMSPEQAQLGTLDVDTRSDIYSLGVLLYQLLTGRTPFDTKELVAAGLDEMRRTIREIEPLKPSTRLSQDLAARVAAPGQSAIRNPQSAIHKDLDWIVMKCLEKDRARRYETATGLASDIERHLTNEPVLASPPSRLYRFQKLVRRNRVTAITTAAVALVLILGVLVSTWQAWRATRAETLAKQRLKESEALSMFLSEVLRSPDPARDGRKITVAETLDRAATNLERDLAMQPARRTNLQRSLARTYEALGLHHEAIALWKKVRDYHLAASGAEHPDTLEVMNNLAVSYAKAGQEDAALKLREQVLPLSRKVKGPEHSDTLAAMNNLAVSLHAVGRWDQALKLQEQLLPLSRKVNGPEHPDTLATMDNLAVSYSSAGRDDEALKLHEQLLPLSRKVNGPEHPATLRVMHNLAISYSVNGRSDEALKLREQLLPLKRKVLGPEHPDTLPTMGSLAFSYAKAGREDEALKLREQVLLLSRKVKGPEHPDTLRDMHNLAVSYHAVGRWDEALKLREQVLPLRRKVLGSEHPDTLWEIIGLADSYRKAGQAEEAVKLGQSSLEIYGRKLGPAHEETLNAMTELAISYRVAGRTVEAIALEQESLKLKSQHLSPGHAMTVESMENLATCYELSNQQPEAEALRRELAKLRGKAVTNGPAKPSQP